MKLSNKQKSNAWLLAAAAVTKAAVEAQAAAPAEAQHLMKIREFMFRKSETVQKNARYRANVKH